MADVGGIRTTVVDAVYNKNGMGFQDRHAIMMVGGESPGDTKHKA